MLGEICATTPSFRLDLYVLNLKIALQHFFKTNLSSALRFKNETYIKQENTLT